MSKFFFNLSDYYKSLAPVAKIYNLGKLHVLAMGLKKEYDSYSPKALSKFVSDMTLWSPSLAASQIVLVYVTIVTWHSHRASHKNPIEHRKL